MKRRPGLLAGASPIAGRRTASPNGTNLPGKAVRPCEPNHNWSHDDLLRLWADVQHTESWSWRHQVRYWASWRPRWAVRLWRRARRP